MTFGQKTVVIVEDEPDTAEMFIEMMRLIGYQVYNSYAGAPAIALIANKKPDAVILDIMMPDLSGLEVMKYMQRDPSLADIPVVVRSPSGHAVTPAARSTIYTEQLAPRGWVEGVQRAMPTFSEDNLQEMIHGG